MCPERLKLDDLFLRSLKLNRPRNNDSSSLNRLDRKSFNLRPDTESSSLKSLNPELFSLNRLNRKSQAESPHLKRKREFLNRLNLSDSPLKPHDRRHLILNRKHSSDS
jgi:hypothetical protein